MRVATFLLFVTSSCAVAYRGMTEEDCATVGKLVDRERNALNAGMDAMVKAYVPSASADDVRGISSFFQTLDGRNICRRAIPCGAHFKCILRSVLQGIGETMMAIPELKMDGYKYCEECKAQMPIFRLAYMLDDTKALMKHNALRTCASFHSEKLCVREVNAWFNTYYEEFAELLTASTTCEDLKFCESTGERDWIVYYD